MKITFSTCFYVFKTKFDKSVYLEWIDNMLSNVNNYYLVVYTDENTLPYFEKYAAVNDKIKIIIKPIQSFYNYKYKNQWIENHKINHLLNQFSDWEVNMLWSEKTSFVEETVSKKYFDTEMYGWCDIGYFRNRENDTPMNNLTMWPNDKKIEYLKKNKIYYGFVNKELGFIKFLKRLICDKNENGLLKHMIPPYKNSVAGGFFILHKDKIQWWKNTYDKKLKLYFDNNRLVKDDQFIIVDCIFSDKEENFCLCTENSEYDNWFMFQRLLS